MKRTLSALACVLVVLLAFESLSEAQTKKRDPPARPGENKSKVVAVNGRRRTEWRSPSNEM